MAEAPGYCSVVETDCLNPAGYRAGSGSCGNSDGPRTRARCYSCGDPVCANCRTGKRGHWVCNNCASRETWWADRLRAEEIAAVKARIYAVAS